ncbi:MAG: ABC transporter substrate-binding protein [Piscinibacter sp.]|nr:ABC transporter substrate-binding protein [Piscinibacter sp.]
MGVNRLMRRAAAVALGLLVGLGAPAQACEVDHKVVFAGLDWDSNAFHTALAQRILRDGMGCQVDLVPGSTIPLFNGMARGDMHVMMEVWSNNTPPSWQAGIEAGKLVEVGVNFPDAVQGWFVPKYLVEGDRAPARGLKSVADLPRFKALFRDPEEPSKGRFLNCIAGWQCELVNSKKLYAYGLAPHFTNFRPGTGAALDAAILSALKRKRPVLFYYWRPTWLLGQIGEQVVMLDEPPYDDARWAALDAVKDPRDARDATAYPVVEVRIGANKAFLDKAPQIRAFLQRYRTSAKLVSEALAYMQRTKGSPDDAARQFLKTHGELWTAWVTPEVAARVRAAL